MLQEQRDSLISRVEKFYDSDAVTSRQSHMDTTMYSLMATGGKLLNGLVDVEGMRTARDLEKGMKAMRGLQAVLAGVEETDVLEIVRTRMQQKLYFTPSPLLSGKGQVVGALYSTSSPDHNISPLMAVASAKVYPSPYRDIQMAPREEVLSVHLLADRHDIVVLSSGGGRGKPCLKVYGSRGALIAQRGHLVPEEVVACAMKRDGRTAAVLTTMGRVYPVDVSGRGDEIPSSPPAVTGIEDYFATCDGCRLVVDDKDRVLVLDKPQLKQVHVHSHFEGHLLATLPIGHAEKPIDIDVCTSRMCILDNNRSIIIYKLVHRRMDQS